jgi:hypothetical protein
MSATSITAAPSARGLGVALRQVGQVVLFAVVPAVVAVTVFATSYHGAGFLYDFHGDLYGAGVAILHGHDPYQASFLARLAAQAHPSTSFAVPVYPAPDLVASVPLALLSLHAAGIVFTALSIAAMALGLWLLGVTDWRCYGLAFVSWPVVHSLRLGQVNELLVLGVAVAWRWRERLWPPAIAVSAVVVAKLFLWPVGVWLLITRRWRVAVLAAVLAVSGTLVAWAAIGFDGLTAYSSMLSHLSRVEGTAGVSLLSLGHALGITRSLSSAAGWVVTLGVLALAWRARSRDAAVLGLVVMAGLLSSPLVWPHYLTLAFVPIALLSPRLSAAWFLPLITYLAPVELTGGDPWKIVPYIGLEMAVIAWLTLARPAGRPRSGC